MSPITAAAAAAIENTEKSEKRKHFTKFYKASARAGKLITQSAFFNSLLMANAHHLSLI